MKRKRIRKLAEDTRHIAGIYNYCDRWCERCPMTSRCLLHSMEREDDDDPAAHDLRNEAFWEKLSEMFTETIAMVREDAAEHGIDLDTDSPEVEARVQREKEIHRDAMEQEPARSAMDYAERVGKWFEAQKPLFERKQEDLMSQATARIEGTNPVADAEAISDALEVISWYQFQIHVKLVRALSAMSDIEDGMDEEAAASDADGSAKVALIGLDRSLGAWAVLREHLPDKGDPVLDFLVQLDRIRRRTEAAFPRARAFKRAGFDD